MMHHQVLLCVYVCEYIGVHTCMHMCVTCVYVCSVVIAYMCVHCVNRQTKEVRYARQCSFHAL